MHIPSQPLQDDIFVIVKGATPPALMMPLAGGCREKTTGRKPPPTTGPVLCPENVDKLEGLTPVYADREETCVLSTHIGGKTLMDATVVTPQSVGHS